MNYFDVLYAQKMGGGSPVPPTPPVPTDGKTRAVIRLEEGRLSPYLGLGLNGDASIDWGDGSSEENMTGSNKNTVVYKKHDYASAGEYTIAIAIEGEAQIFGSSNYTYFFSKKTSSSTDKVYSNALQSLILGNNVSIGTYAFSNCMSLASITIPDAIRSIDTYAFNNCFSLVTAKLPDRLLMISSYLFNNCYSLKSISIPNNVASIETRAFSECSALTSVTIPESVATISATAFYNCVGLGFIKFESINPPMVSNINAWTNVPTDCKILVPAGTLETYKAAKNYPNPSSYTYEEYVA